MQCQTPVGVWDFRAESLGFNPWQDHEDRTIAQCTLHKCVFLNQGVLILVVEVKSATDWRKSGK